MCDKSLTTWLAFQNQVAIKVALCDCLSDNCISTVWTTDFGHLMVYNTINDELMQEKSFAALRIYHNTKNIHSSLLTRTRTTLILLIYWHSKWPL